MEFGFLIVKCHDVVFFFWGGGANLVSTLPGKTGIEFVVLNFTTFFAMRNENCHLQFTPGTFSCKKPPICMSQSAQRVNVQTASEYVSSSGRGTRSPASPILGTLNIFRGHHSLLCLTDCLPQYSFICIVRQHTEKTHPKS